MSSWPLWWWTGARGLALARLALVGLVVACVGGPAARAAADDWSLTRSGEGAPAGEAKPRRRKASVPVPKTQEDVAGHRRQALTERYLRAITADPADPFAWDRLLQLYREQGGMAFLRQDLKARLSSADPTQASRLALLLGRIELSEGNSMTAREHFERAASLTDSEHPHVALSELAKREGDLAGARTALNAALRRTRDRERQQQLRRQAAELALEAADYEAAEQAYRSMAQRPDTSLHARTEYGRALAARGDYRRALDAYRRTLAEVQGDHRVMVPIWIAVAKLELEVGEHRSALATLARARRFARAQSGLRVEIDEMRVEVHRRADSLHIFADTLGKRTSDVESLRLLAGVWDELGEREKAIDAFGKLLRREPRVQETRARLVRLLLASGRLEEAIEHGRWLVQQSPESPEYVIELASLLEQTGRRREAIGFTERVARRAPRGVALHQALYKLYLRWGETDRAEAALRTLVRVDPHNPAHLITLGEQQLRAGNRDGAFRSWRQILTLGGNDKTEAYGRLAGVLVEHAMLPEALQALREAVQREPEHVGHVQGLARVLEQLDRHGEAVDAWQRVLELAREATHRTEARRRIVALWSKSGVLRRKLTDFERAFQPTLSASASSPPDVEAGYFLAEIYRVLAGRGGEASAEHARRAEEVLERLVAVQEGNVSSLLTLEQLRALRGDRAGALSTLETLVEVDPRNASRYLEKMATHALHLYRDDAGIAYAERIVKLRPQDAASHRVLAEAHRARHDWEAAIRSYLRALELDERQVEVRSRLADVYTRLGRLAEAEEHLCRVLRDASDDTWVELAGRQALRIHLGKDGHGCLEETLLASAIAHPRRRAYRRLLLAMYESRLEGYASDRNTSGGAREVHDMVERAIKPLLDALTDADPAEQRLALRFLEVSPRPAAIQPLMILARSAAPLDIRQRAVVIVGQVAGPEAIGALEGLAARVELQTHATWALGRLQASHAPAALRRLLSSPHSEVRAMALLGLAERLGDDIGEEDVGYVLALLRDDRNALVRACAAWTLGRWGVGASVEPLVYLLETRERVEREAAIAALGMLEDARAQQALARVWVQGEAPHRRLAQAALAWAGSPRTYRVDPLPAPTVHTGAARLLEQRLARFAKSVSKPLDDATSPVLVQALREGLQGPPDVVSKALRALRHVSLESVSSALLALSEDSDAALRAEALRAVVEHGAQMPSPLAADHWAFELVMRGLDDSVSQVQRMALEVLMTLRVRDPRALQARVQRIALTHSDWTLRMRAVEVLHRAEGGGGREEGLVKVLLGDEYAYVRERAAEALGTLGGARTLRTLRVVAGEDTDAEVRKAAKRAIAQIGHRSDMLAHIVPR